MRPPTIKHAASIILMFAGAAVLVLLALPAMATTPEPPPKPPGHHHGHHHHATQAAAEAAAKATSSATASSSASGGSVQSRSGDLFVLPAPVFVPPMPALPCPAAQVEQQAIGIGWNFVSQSSARTDTRDCTAIIVINSLIERCQYGRAQRALDMLAVRALPGFEVAPTAYPDLEPAACAALKAPVLTPSASPVNLIAAEPKACEPAPAPKAVAKAKKPAKRAVCKA
jgi:hypothetical protein